MKGDRLHRLHHLLASVAMMEFEKAYEAAHGSKIPATPTPGPDFESDPKAEPKARKPRKTTSA